MSDWRIATLQGMGVQVYGITLRFAERRKLGPMAVNTARGLIGTILEDLNGRDWAHRWWSPGKQDARLLAPYVLRPVQREGEAEELSFTLLLCGAEGERERALLEAMAALRSGYGRSAGWHFGARRDRTAVTDVALELLPTPAFQVPARETKQTLCLELHHPTPLAGRGRQFGPEPERLTPGRFLQAGLTRLEALGAQYGSGPSPLPDAQDLLARLAQRSWVGARDLHWRPCSGRSVAGTRYDFAGWQGWWEWREVPWPVAEMLELLSLFHLGWRANWGAGCFYLDQIRTTREGKAPPEYHQPTPKSCSKAQRSGHNYAESP